MKRIFALILCLLPLCACGRTVPAEETAMPAAKNPATQVPKEITWQLLDPESGDVKDFLQTSGQPRADTADGAALSDTVKIYAKPNADGRDLWMRDDAQGKDVLLLAYDKENNRIPCFMDAIDSRYFLYQWAIGGSGSFFAPVVFDTVKCATIPISYPEQFDCYAGTVEGRVYFVHTGNGLRVTCADTSVLAKGEKLAAQVVLEDVPEYAAFLKDLPACGTTFAMSPDARYLAVFNEDQNPVLHIFAIDQSKLVYTLPLPQGLGDNLKLEFPEPHILYWFGESNAAEITLP